MKIILVTGTFKPSINGIAISVEVFTRNLIKFGHKVLVLAPQNNNYKDDKEVLRYPSMPNPFFSDYPIPLLPLTPEIYEKVKKFKPDVVHVHHPFHIGYFASFISEQLKIPLVFTYHTKHDYYANQYFKFLPKDLGSKFIGNSVLDFCKKCDLVITPSREIQNFLKRKHVINTVVIPSIVDDLKKTFTSKQKLREILNLPQDKKILLFVGRLAKEKNLQLIIKSMIKLPSEFILVMCGTGPLEGKIKKTIEDLNLQNRIILRGKIERLEMSSYYSSADYFYYPSISEAQGLVYSEALSFGLPIISVDSLVAHEYVKSDFGILSENNPSKIASHAIEISKVDYKLLSQNAINFSKRFSTKKSVVKMVGEYSKLVKGNKLTQNLLLTGWQSWSSDSKNKPRLFYERNYLPLNREFINTSIFSKFKLKKPIKGWVSWYAFGRNIDEEKIINQVDWFANRKDIPIEYILIDEGYCKWGDWHNWDRNKFPKGLSYIQKYISNRGMKMGIWIAPFLVERDSDLHKNHPEWTTQMKDEPVLGIKGSVFDKYVFERYILDIRKKKVRDFVFATIDNILKDGEIKLIKLDFLFCIYFIPNITSMEAGSFIRDIFKYIKIKYPQVYTIACGVPLSPITGVADSVRIGPDTISPVVERIPLIFKIFNRIRIKEVFANIDRRQWTKKYWNLDPDAFVCRGNLGFGDKTINKLSDYIKKCGGNLFLGDDMTNLSERRIEKFILPLFSKK